jgi:Tol biopolymer transport system component
LYVADSDGSNPRKIVGFAGNGGWPRVSSDGKRIRFTITGDDLTDSLWEVTSGGAGLHQLLKGWHSVPNECCGRWTQDGKYFVFQYQNAEGRWDLWALPERSGWFHAGDRSPFQLTNGPLSYVLPEPSPDGRQLFAVGSKRRGELLRYDGKTQQYVPYAGGPSAVDARGSADGKWVVYVAYPDRTLWRSRPDGTERMQLTYPPMAVLFPTISPRGTKVAFTGIELAKHTNRDQCPRCGHDLHVVNIETGISGDITDGGAMAWSPDEKSIVFMAPVPGKHIFEEGFLQYYVVDLQTKKVSTIPDSVGMDAVPFWPEANTLLAVRSDAKIMAFDFKTRKWSEFTHAKFGLYLSASPDGRYLYSNPVGNEVEGGNVMRLRLSDRKIETVLDLKGLPRVEVEPIMGIGLPTWLGATPDGSILVTRDIGTQEIYALDIKWP